MADKIGDVYYVAHVRGDGLEKEAKRAGKKAGTEMGKSAQKSFDAEMGKLARDLEKKFDDAGKLSGAKFSKSLKSQLRASRAKLSDELAGIFSDRDTFKDFIADSDRVGEGLERLGAKLKKAKEFGILTDDQFKSLKFTMENWGKSLKKSEGDQDAYNASLREFQAEMEKSARNHEAVSEAWARAEKNKADALERSKVELKEQLYIQKQANDEIERSRAVLVDQHKEILSSNSAWREFADRFEGNAEAVDHFRASLDNMRESGALSDRDFHKMSDGLDRIRIKFDDTTKSVEKSNHAIGEHQSLWKGLSHNLRQGIVIVAAVAAGFQQIATLGSAAGAGVTIFATTVLAAIPAVGILVGGIVSLAATLADENAQLPGYAQNIKNLGTAFQELGNGIERELFGGALDGAVVRFTNNTLPQLTGAINGVASSLSTTLAGALDRLGESKAVDQFNTILGMSGEVMDRLVGATLNLVSALAGITVAAGPSIQKFTGWLEKITGEFDDWANSPIGQGKLKEWFSNGTRILSAFGDLLGRVGDLFADLVTPESVDRAIEFIENLSKAMDFVQSIAESLGALDAFGLIAQLLGEFGTALSPILDLLTPIFAILNDISSVGITMMASGLKLLTPLLIPLQIGLELWAHVFEKLTTYFQPLTDAMFGLTDPLNGMTDSIVAGVTPALDNFLDSLLALLPSPEEMARIITEEVIPAIQDFADWVVNTAIPALTDMYNLLNTTVIPILTVLWQTFDDGITAIKKWESAFLGAIDPVIDKVIDAVQWISRLLGLGVQIKNVQGFSTRTLERTATGGTFYTPQVRQIAEAGAEMVVPLQRPLSQVDPSVRAVAAYAQGKDVPSSPGKSVNFEAGAFTVITPTENPVLVASMVMNEVVEVALN